MTTERRRCFVLALLAAPACAADEESTPAFVQPRPGPELAGDTPNEWLGYSVAAAGDVTGDGSVDLLVSEHASSVGGRVSVVAGPLRADVRWRDRVVATVVGEYGFANLGDWLAHAGGCDVNGDGHADLLLGSPFADTNDVAQTPIRSGDNAGKAYLVFGGPDLVGDRSIADAQVQLLGEAPFDTAGSAVACLRDLDGDGLDDVAVAAKGSARGGAEDTGAVYLLYGRTVWPAVMALGDADAVLTGDQAYEQAGTAVSPAGDVDGDGRGDLLVGAPNADVAGEDDGLAYLLLGDGERIVGEVPLRSRATRLQSQAASARLGWSLAPLGDFDGDGLDDFVIGSSTAPIAPDDPGAAWIVLGGPGLVDSVDLDDRGTRVEGASAGELAGFAVAGVGDMTGDGLSDLVVGAVQAEHDGVTAGRVTLVAGRAAPGSRLRLADEPWHAFGSQADEAFGETIVPLGDIDADTRPDFAATAKGWNERRGLVRLFLAGDPDGAPAP
jgi:hypothetical protein